jgi:hypothetical protein
MAIAGKEPDAGAVPPGHHPIAVVLDLVPRGKTCVSPRRCNDCTIEGRTYGTRLPREISGNSPAFEG